MRPVWVLLICLFLTIVKPESAGVGIDYRDGILLSDRYSHTLTTDDYLGQANALFIKAASGRVVDSTAAAGINHIQGVTTITTDDGLFTFFPLILTTPPLFPPEDLENEQSIAGKLNEQRVLAGLSKLTLAPELTQSSRKHSRDMADNDFTSHTGSDGSNPGQRISEAGYDAWAWGEIIGWGFGGNTSWMVDWWMNSPVHKSLILSSTYFDFGVGYTRDTSSSWGHYWTVNFGVSRSSNDHGFEESFHRCTYLITSQSGGSSLTIYTTDPCP